MAIDYEAMMAANADIGYSVGSIDFQDKVSALIASNHDPSLVQFHWRPSVFDNVDWTLEPTLDLKTLVDQHVKSIRDSYDHVCLWFSGGFDSYTIFRAFLRCGLTIDEFFIYDRDWNHGLSETDCVVAEHTAYLIKQTIWPRLKITSVRWGDHCSVYKFFRTHKTDWIYHANNVFRISQNSRPFLYSMNDQVRRTYVAGKNIVINGIDKPRLDLRDGQWYACRTDAALYSEKDPVTLHFWTLPDLYVKQCWMMIRWLESLPGLDHDMVHALQSHRLGDDLYNHWNLAIGRDWPMHGFCHGVGDKNTFGGALNCAEAKPLLQHAALSAPDVLKIYHQGLEQLSILVGEAWHKERLPTMISRPYPVVAKGAVCQT